jgi:AcrR family transcriptional regulator
MGEHTKHSASRSELRERIIQTAVEAFSTHGIKSITMDDIAASLGISKRTLYEVFSDKESLLEECILTEQRSTDVLIKQILDTSSNVLEVILRCYQWTIEKFHATNKKFFEDIKKYPKAYELVKRNHNRSSDDTVNFFKEGVKQGLFRSDVNFAIVNLLVRGQIDLLINSNICDDYSFLEVYESIMFTFLRGISTEKGSRELDNFIYEYREKHTHSDETRK